MKHYELAELGYTSWLELYEAMAAQGLQDEQKVTLSWEGTDESDRPDAVVYMSQIKAGAFAEIYPALPLKATIEVMNDLLDNANEAVVNKFTSPVQEFLNKIPTRAQ